MSDYFDFGSALAQLDRTALSLLKDKFRQTDEICRYNTGKVMEAFRRAGVSESCLGGSTGYGYGDRGRDAAEQVFAFAFGAEAALVRHQFVSGTHAIATALFGLLRPGQTLFCATGRPYDTLCPVVGITGEKGEGSLAEFGVKYREASLTPDGKPDLSAIEEGAAGAATVHIQRSRGYTLRESLSTGAIAEIISAVRRVNPQAQIVVDNCYGEFVETREPCDKSVGADIIVGSLIKNPGGSIARCGGYIAGKKRAVELCAARYSAPGVGGEAGCSLSETRNILQGFFFAPQVVCSAVKTADYLSCMSELSGLEVQPHFSEPRADIITSVILKTPEQLLKFCRGIQAGSPVDSFVSPEAWDMPGYENQVVMASGSFVGGSSIELSADGPMREPYAAFVQGGVTFESGRYGVLNALKTVAEL